MVYYYVIHNCRTVPLLARHVCLQDDKKLAKTTPDIIPKLIAFAPSVELLFSNRDDVHKTALNTLITAAILSGRTPALPLVPCDSPWIQHLSDDERHRRGNEDFGTVGDRNVIQFGPKTDLKCFWKAWSCRKCDQITVPWYDFQKLLEGAPKQDRFPNEGSLLQLGKDMFCHCSVVEAGTICAQCLHIMDGLLGKRKSRKKKKYSGFNLVPDVEGSNPRINGCRFLNSTVTATNGSSRKLAVMRKSHIRVRVGPSPIRPLTPDSKQTSVTHD